jgi:putative cardiolipin synthase
MLASAAQRSHLRAREKYRILKRPKFLKLRPPGPGPKSHVDLDTGSTTLAREIDRRAPDDDTLTGHKLLRHGKDAFAARVLLARSAERTLDVQYYIWHDDLSGSLLLDELKDAAGRGVRVRLIVDDIGTARLDARLSMLAELPNFEVRLYNPCVVRWPKPINYLFAFRRLNCRMHAKSFTVDNQATIVGGRNIGDEYFAARKKGQFADLDVLAVGAVVTDVSRAFDRYWNGTDVYPVHGVARRVTARKRRQVEQAAIALAHSARAQRYRDAVGKRRLLGEMIDGTVSMIWACSRLINHDYSDRKRGEGPNDLSTLMPAGLDRPQRELDVISGYFVPTPGGTAQLAALARNGVRVRVLTNSFAATDVGFVHTGYAPCRPALLDAGVKLYEMPAPDDKPKTATKFVRTTSARRRALRDEGRSLHAKTIGVDGRQVYVGSANFDPRSAHLNTEMGLLIDSPELASGLSRSFDQDISETVYCLSSDGHGVISWTDARDDDPEPESTEPGTTIFSRTLVWLLSCLPIDSYL